MGSSLIVGITISEAIKCEKGYFEFPVFNVLTGEQEGTEKIEVPFLELFGHKVQRSTKHVRFNRSFGSYHYDVGSAILDHLFSLGIAKKDDPNENFYVSSSTPDFDKTPIGVTVKMDKSQRYLSVAETQDVTKAFSKFHEILRLAGIKDNFKPKMYFSYF